MTQEEVDLLFKRDEEIRAAREKERQRGPRKVSTNKIINFAVDETIYNVFKERVAQSHSTVPMILRAAVLSYAFGGLGLQEDRLKSINDLYNSKGSLSQDTSPKPVGRPPKDKPVEEAPTHSAYNLDAKGKLLQCQDWDYSKMKLEDFDYPDNIHPNLQRKCKDGSVMPFLQGFDIGPRTKETFEDVLRNEYDWARNEFSDPRMWNVHYFTFTRYCAKKFLMTNHLIDTMYYSEDNIQKYLYTIKDELEENYLNIFLPSKLEYERTREVAS